MAGSSLLTLIDMPASHSAVAKIFYYTLPAATRRKLQLSHAATSVGKASTMIYGQLFLAIKIGSDELLFHVARIRSDAILGLDALAKGKAVIDENKDTVEINGRKFARNRGAGTWHQCVDNHRVDLSVICKVEIVMSTMILRGMMVEQ